MERVYRYFSTPEEMFVYLKGGWRGAGVHGIAQIEADYSMQMTLQAKNDALVFQIRPLQRKKKSALDKIRSLLGKSKPKEKKPDESRVEAPLNLWQTDLDLARSESGPWKLSIQAMDEKQSYVTVEKNSTLFFSGRLQRR